MTSNLDKSQFAVGTIVYFIAAKSQNVIPGLVCEKIVRTSIDGSSKVNYVLEVRVTEGMKKVEVDPTKSQLFSSANDIETYLIERAVGQIKEIVKEASTRAGVFADRVKKSAEFQPKDAITAEANKELGMLSKELARIILDVPVEFDATDFELNQPDLPAVISVFEDLEFRQLTRNLVNTFGNDSSEHKASTNRS